MREEAGKMMILHMKSIQENHQKEAERKRERENSRTLPGRNRIRRSRVSTLIMFTILQQMLKSSWQQSCSVNLIIAWSLPLLLLAIGLTLSSKFSKNKRVGSLADCIDHVVNNKQHNTFNIFNDMLLRVYIFSNIHDKLGSQ